MFINCKLYTQSSQTINSVKIIYLTPPSPSFCIILGNLAQAEAVGREALELIPNDHSLMFSLANVLGKSQKYKVA